MKIVVKKHVDSKHIQRIYPLIGLMLFHHKEMPKRYPTQKSTIRLDSFFE